MKIAIGLLLFIFLSCSGGGYSDPNGAIPEAGNEDYVEAPTGLVANEFADADKTGGDDQLCWIATAANAITAAGWADDENFVFDRLKRRFENDVGKIIVALRYYFDNVLREDINRHVIIEQRQGKIWNFIKSQLYQGRAVAISTISPGNDSGHTLSVYGYDYVDGDNYIAFADSDDCEYQLIEKLIHIDGKPTIEYRQSRIRYAISLARKK